MASLEVEQIYSNKITNFNTDFIKVDAADKLAQVLSVDVNTPSAVVAASATDVDAGTDTFTKAHDFTTGLKIQMTTSGALPTGLSLATDYFVIVVTAGVSFKLATSLVNALAGTAINITSTGTGNQTATPVALAACTYSIEGSPTDASLVDGIWAPIGSPVAIAADSTILTTNAQELLVLPSKYMRVAFVLTAGRISIPQYVHAHVDSEAV